MPAFLTKLIASAGIALALMSGSLSRGSDGYRLVFTEEFDSAELNRELWQTTMAFVGRQGARYHNDSYLSYATDEDILLNGGHLRLRADRREVLGDDPKGIFTYTQGFISTHQRFAFTYGYVEIFARMPSGRGLWPTFWLMPVDFSLWPPEFDIAEYYAGSETLRFGLATGTMTAVKWDDICLENRAVTERWHVYGLLWEPGRAVWMLDGEVKLEVRGDHVPASAMYLILNNAVSSRVGPSGEPNEHTVFPSYLEIDYVRVYQKSPEPVPVAER